MFKCIRNLLKKIFTSQIKWSRTQYLLFLDFVLNNLSNHELNIKKSDEIDNPLNLEDLTPNAQADHNNHKPYLDALNWAILNDNVLNIGLSGSYGTGKSTILNSFCLQNRGHNYLKISLANFQIKGKENLKNKNIEEQIENSVVQQMLYFENKKRLKDSRFNRIHPNKNEVVKAILFSIWIISFVYLFFPKINNSYYIDVNHYLPDYIPKIYFLAGVFFLLIYLFRQLTELRITKLTPKEIEASRKSFEPSSIINRNIDEILYFFEQSNTNVVIIEDIDRFEEGIEVIIKLRELNTLINNSKDITRKVKFIYAIKEDIFSKENEKTKFFDLVVPVIPIINYNNAYNKLFEKLKTEFIDSGKLDVDMLKNIAPFITDMRTVINIINEFKIYYHIKKSLKNVDANKLFALIVYKNIYPFDFKNLLNKHGAVHSIFNSKNLICEKIMDEFSREIERKNQHLEQLNSEKIKDLYELHSIYVLSILRKIPSARCIVVPNVEVPQLVEDQYFEKLFVDNIQYGNRIDNAYNFSNISFSQIEKEINPNMSYKEREEMLKGNLDNKIIKLKSEINSLKTQLHISKTNSLSSIFETQSTDYIESYFNNYINEGSFVDTDTSLLKFLLKEGFIDENYIEYISYFHEGTLSVNDNELKLRIIQGAETYFDEKIDNVKLLIEDLTVSKTTNNFNKKSILIFEIFDYLLNASSIYSTEITNYKYILFQAENEMKLDSFITLITGNNSIQGRIFLAEYIKRLDGLSNKDKIQKQFYLTISKWDLFWITVNSSDEFDDALKLNVALDLLKYFGNSESNKVLAYLNSENSLSNFINNQYSIISKLKDISNPEEISQTLLTLGVKFKNIAFGYDHPKLLQMVYENNLYEINLYNIMPLLQWFNKNEIPKELITTGNYMAIQLSSCIPMKNYIDQNINAYIQKAYLGSPQNLDNNHIYLFIDLLNNVNIEINLKKEIVNNGKGLTIIDIDSVENKELWSHLMESNIGRKWINYIKYFSENLSPSFTTYLKDESVYNTLHEHKINENLEDFKVTDKIIEDFNEEIITSKLPPECFEKIVGCLTLNIENLEDLVSEVEDHNELPDYVLKNLLEHNFIECNNDNLVFLNDKKDLKILLVEKNEAVFIEHIEDYELDNTDFVNIINSSLSIENKIKCIEDIVNKSDAYAEDINVIKVLPPFLMANNYTEIISPELLFNFLKSNALLSDKVNFFVFNIPVCDNEMIRRAIENLDGDYRNILEGNNFSLPVSKENLKLVDLLKERNFVEYNIEKSEIKVFFSNDEGIK